jgi:Cft2 family RNA processing exonuclease
MFFDIKAMPKDIYELPVTLIEESTYGTTSNGTIKRVFDDNLVEAVDMKHTFIAPVFALGRTQEILLKIRRLQEAGKLDESVPIFLDGNLAQSYTSYYNHHQKLLREDTRNFMPENLSMVHEFSEREALLKKTGAKIILTTSGMGSYGPAQFYLPYYITRSDATIHFCGYTTPNTFGRVLQDTPDGELIDIKGVVVEKKARVLSTNEFSGHAKKEDLIDSITQFPNAKSVLVNHGDTQVKQEYAQTVESTVHPSKGVEILGPDKCVRVGAYGIIKTLPVTDLEFRTFETPEVQEKGRQKQKLFRRKNH